MRTRTALLLCLPCLLPLLACAGPPARQTLSFTEVQRLVDGKTAAEVERLLGDPDLRESILDDEQRWVWWNHAVLDGLQYAPEVRGQVVHLEITFQLQRGSPATGEPAPAEEWRVLGPFAVSYSRPAVRR